jgi:hypothetical protein
VKLADCVILFAFVEAESYVYGGKLACTVHLEHVGVYDATVEMIEELEIRPDEGERLAGPCASILCFGDHLISLIALQF